MLQVYQEGSAWLPAAQKYLCMTFGSPTTGQSFVDAGHFFSVQMGIAHRRYSHDAPPSPGGVIAKFFLTSLIMLGSDALSLSIYKVLLKGWWSGGWLVLGLLVAVVRQSVLSIAPAGPPNQLIIWDKLRVLFGDDNARRSLDHNIQNIFPGWFFHTNGWFYDLLGDFNGNICQYPQLPQLPKT